MNEALQYPITQRKLEEAERTIASLRSQLGAVREACCALRRHMSKAQPKLILVTIAVSVADYEGMQQVIAKKDEQALAQAVVNIATNPDNQITVVM